MCRSELRRYDLLIDLAQEGQPLLMAMARSGVGKHLAGKVVERGKEGHRSMAIIVLAAYSVIFVHDQSVDDLLLPNFNQPDKAKIDYKFTLSANMFLHRFARFRAELRT